MKQLKLDLLEAIGEIRPDIELDSVNDFELHGVLDSLDVVLLVDEIESNMNIEIDVSKINPDIFKSFSTLLSYLEELSN